MGQALRLHHPEQFDVEDEGGASGDAGLVEAAVGFFGRDVYLPAVAYVHMAKGYDPAGDEVAQAEGGGC